MIVRVSLKKGGKLVFTGNVLKVYSIGDEKGKKLAIETADKVTSFKFLCYFKGMNIFIYCFYTTCCMTKLGNIKWIW